MFIPKSKMPVIMDAMLQAIAIGEWSKEDKEILAQLHDRASLCHHGDAPFLEVEVCYSNNPCANVQFDKKVNVNEPE